MAATQQGTPINILWPRVDLNDGTINGTQRTWVYCDKNSPLRNTPNANAAFDSDGNLVDLTPVNSSWYSTPEDAPGALHPATAYTLLNSHSFCNSKSGNPDDLNPSDCNCFTKDTDQILDCQSIQSTGALFWVSLDSFYLGYRCFHLCLALSINKPGYFTYPLS
ncbi:hypothetical protein BCR33DRAFT_841315 [Rhizoclosmatium globosum]|uniref:Uncharacterized protein n=1 Tax=Rhizoclosmatium globosum TaxID=329046 RepID=A0A1Y2CUP5_9FUNG|nr:hypothetical protein BCR33DRAFT_841315 [Rhizoclosmatium globosum]|eukprot:ORY50035.1 hypothetical protein BCR33DRAFT_841315 [Rhizoclosmatium globosum]